MFYILIYIYIHIHIYIYIYIWVIIRRTVLRVVIRKTILRVVLNKARRAGPGPNKERLSGQALSPTWKGSAGGPKPGKAQYFSVIGFYG